MQEQKKRSSKRTVIGIAVAAVLMALFCVCKKSEPSPPEPLPVDVGKVPPPVNIEPFPLPPSPVPPTSIRLIDEMLSRLEWGNIVFNAPKLMRFKETETIELLLSNSMSEPQLRAELEKVTEVDSARVRISNRMEARLSGKGFQIEALVPETQSISSEGVAKWKWDVTATGGGSQHLHLTLSAILTVSGRDTPFVIRTYDRYIAVKITLVQRFSSFFAEHWKWLWATIFFPIGGYVWKKYHKKKPEKEPTKNRGGEN